MAGKEKGNLGWVKGLSGYLNEKIGAIIRKNSSFGGSFVIFSNLCG